jgi:hypothetical protein
MKPGRNRRHGPFWLRLAVAYILLAILWPLVLSTYAGNLGAISRPFVRLLASNPVAARSAHADGTLNMDVIVADSTGGHHNIRIGLDPIRHGFSHITFAALVISIAGWTWRQRLWRWVCGAAIIEAFNVGIVLLNVFGDIAAMRLDYWHGDLITRILPADIYGAHRNLVTLVGSQFVPVFLWLALFVFPEHRPRRTQI